MASFPNTIKEFIAKIAHTDKVQSADINALQEEVAAIETTLLSGTDGQVLTSGSSGVPNWAESAGGGFPKVPITQNWTSASSVMQDIFSSIGTSASTLSNIPANYEGINFDIVSFEDDTYATITLYTSGNISFYTNWTNGSPISDYSIVSMYMKWSSY